jgi:hypothetical protein
MVGPEPSSLVLGLFAAVAGTGLIALRRAGYFAARQ